MQIQRELQENLKIASINVAWGSEYYVFESLKKKECLVEKVRLRDLCHLLFISLFSVCYVNAFNAPAASVVNVGFALALTLCNSDIMLGKWNVTNKTDISEIKFKTQRLNYLHVFYCVNSLLVDNLVAPSIGMADPLLKMKTII